jgi:hypothetical protein
VLARLDQDLAPLRSAVNREGTFLRVHGAGDAADLRVSEIVDQLGYVAERLEAAPSVARWFGTSDVDELSQEEASVLMRSIGDAVLRAAKARPPPPRMTSLHSAR